MPDEFMSAQIQMSAVANNKGFTLTRKRNGFTLIELIVYIGLVTIFLSGAVAFMWNGILASQKAGIQNEVNENMRLSVQKLSFEIRNSSGINSVTSSSLSLSNTDTARNPTVFDVSGGRLRMGFGSGGTCPATNPCPITSNKVQVSNLNFENLSVAGLSKNIRFTLTITATGQRSEWQKTSTYSETAEIRSK